jgi:hypothetical protein
MAVFNAKTLAKLGYHANFSPLLAVLQRLFFEKWFLDLVGLLLVAMSHFRLVNLAQAAT